jgi:hypothetical protein
MGVAVQPLRAGAVQAGDGVRVTIATPHRVVGGGLLLDLDEVVREARQHIGRPHHYQVGIGAPDVQPGVAQRERLLDEVPVFLDEAHDGTAAFPVADCRGNPSIRRRGRRAWPIAVFVKVDPPG